jgi:hypothetical protein
MSDIVGFLLDGQEVLTYDRSQTLPDKQREYLDILDKQMDEGCFKFGKHPVKRR